MATHSSVLAWRIPGTGEPGGLPSLGLHRVGHDWSAFAVSVFHHEYVPQIAYLLPVEGHLGFFPPVWGDYKLSYCKHSCAGFCVKLFPFLLGKYLQMGMLSQVVKAELTRRNCQTAFQNASAICMSIGMWAPWVIMQHGTRVNKKFDLLVPWIGLVYLYFQVLPLLFLFPRAQSHLLL